MPSQPMTIKEAAAILGIHPRKVNRLITAGEIKAFKAFDGLRAPWLIPTTEVDRIKAEAAT